MTSTEVFLGLAAAILLAIVVSKSKRSKLPLPPGPKGLPIIGSLLNVGIIFMPIPQHVKFPTDRFPLTVTGLDLMNGHRNMVFIHTFKKLIGYN